MTDLPPTELLESSSIAKLMPALIEAQNAFAPAVKDSNNPAFGTGGRMYLSLSGVLNAIEQPLRDSGIAIVQQTTISDTATVLLTRLIHTSGEWLGSRYPVKPVKQDPQGEGSALTYARRYALMALAGIAPEDDDGNAASRAATEPPPPPDPRIALFSEVKTVGYSLKLADAEIADDFKAWSTGTAIGAASPEQLTQYIAHLREQAKQNGAS